MKRIYLITFSSALLVVLAAFCLHVLMRDDTKQRKITIGFVYVEIPVPPIRAILSRRRGQLKRNTPGR